MIPVALQAEPSHFEGRVRQPGLAFLHKKPRPTTAEFASHAYWQRVYDDILILYNRICAYTGCKIICGEQIDHFLPKNKYPDLAYEWSNYRLSYGKINQYKLSCDDILDPFEIEEGWFVLDFPSCLVKPKRDLGADLVEKINITIDRLGLNRDESLVQSRCSIVKAYVCGHISFNHLQDYYPFIAFEIDRQGLKASMQDVFLL